MKKFSKFYDLKKNLGRVLQETQKRATGREKGEFREFKVCIIPNGGSGSGGQGNKKFAIAKEFQQAKAGINVQGWQMQKWQT
jgi:hypothetical protein